MCIISACDEPERPRSKLCQNCASNLYTWKKKGARRIMARREKLQKWNDRMSYLSREKK